MRKNMNPLDRARAAFQKGVGKSQYQIQERGIVGWQISDSQVVTRVPGRPNFLYVTRPGITVHIARNQASVPRSAFYRVRMVLEDDTYVIIGRDNSDGNVFDLIPDSPSGVLPHPLEEHTDIVFTSSVAGDVLTYDGADWIDETPIVTSAGAGDAGKLIRLDAAGHVDATMINDGDIDHTAITNIGTNTHAQIDTHIAATTAHGATGAVMGTTNAQLTQNKTLDSTNISTLTAKTTPVDADSAVIVDSAAANVFKAVTYTNIKAFLKTYFDTIYEGLGAVATHAALTIAHGATGAVAGTTNAQTFTNKTLDSTNISTLTSKGTPIDADSIVLVDSAAANVFKRTTGTDFKAFLKTYFDTIYGRLAVLNTWTENQTIASTTTVGNALQVIRNLGAASTTGAVVNIIDDHASDDATALRVQQDGTGAILDLLDGATVVLRVNDGGRLDVAQIIRALTSSGLRLEDDGGNLGLHLLDGGTILITNADAPLTTERIVAATTGVVASQILRATSTGNMADTFGPLMTFQIKDDAAVENAIAHLGAMRDGADNTGALIGYLRNAGALVEVLRIISAATDGIMIIGGLATVGASRLGIKAGTSTNDAAVGGVLYQTHTTVGQVGAGPDILASYTIPASTLAVNGQSIWWEAQGNIDLAGGSATITIEFGATTVCTVSSSLTGSWYAKGRIFRSGAATQVASGFSITQGGATPAGAAPGETLSGSIVLRIRGDSTADQNDDTTVDTFIVGWDDANV